MLRVPGIELTNGHRLTHVVSSGALAFDGKGWWWEWPLVWLGLIRPDLFTVTIKSLTLEPRKGNLSMLHPWTCVRPIPGGAVNKVGLTNPGIRWWIKNVAPRIDFGRQRIILSLFGTPKEVREMAKMGNDFDFAAQEVNGSCPNSGSGLDNKATINSSIAASEVSRHPTITKVSSAQNYLFIASELKGIAQAISLNSVPWEKAMSSSGTTPRSPLWPLEKKEIRRNGKSAGGGGVSGIPAQSFNWTAAREIDEQGCIPVIWPSAMSLEDVETILGRGARAIGYGTMFLRSPLLPTRIVKELQER